MEFFIAFDYTKIALLFEFDSGNIIEFKVFYF